MPSVRKTAWNPFSSGQIDKGEVDADRRRSARGRRVVRRDLPGHDRFSPFLYLPPGRYRTGREENGKPVFLEVSEAMSERIKAGEQEHADDIKRARDISIKEAEDVLDKHVIGTTFPAAATKEEAERKVLDRILANLTHPGLGADQSRWGEIYRKLYSKTEERDLNGWHRFSHAYPKEAGGEVTYQLVDVRTKIGETPPEKLIRY